MVQTRASGARLTQHRNAFPRPQTPAPEMAHHARDPPQAVPTDDTSGPVQHDPAPPTRTPPTPAPSAPAPAPATATTKFVSDPQWTKGDVYDMGNVKRARPNLAAWPSWHDVDWSTRAWPHHWSSTEEKAKAFSSFEADPPPDGVHTMVAWDSRGGTLNQAAAYAQFPNVKSFVTYLDTAGQSPFPAANPPGGLRRWRPGPPPAHVRSLGRERLGSPRGQGPRGQRGVVRALPTYNVY